MKFDYVFANPPYFNRNPDAINRMILDCSDKAVILNTRRSFRALADRLEIYYFGFFGQDVEQRVFLGVSGGGHSVLVRKYKVRKVDPENPPPVKKSVICAFSYTTKIPYPPNGQSVSAFWNNDNIAGRLGHGYFYISFTEKEKADFMAELHKAEDPDRFFYYAFRGFYAIEKKPCFLKTHTN